jgi:hypothetical protein
MKYLLLYNININKKKIKKETINYLNKWVNLLVLRQLHNVEAIIKDSIKGLWKI